MRRVKIAVDVSIARRAVPLLEAAGVDVVVRAENGEDDHDWFRRGLMAGARIFVSADQDLGVLCRRMHDKLRGGCFWLRLPGDRPRFRWRVQAAWIVARLLRWDMIDPPSENGLNPAPVGATLDDVHT